MSPSVLGHPIRRREDPALLTGRARFVADLQLDGTLAACFVRSPAAHAQIVSVDASEARSSPGVVAVLEAADLELPGLPEAAPPTGGPRPGLDRPCLATGEVRFAGEAVAVVVAETAAAAADAAGLVTLELRTLPAVIGPSAALDAGAAVLFPDLGSNLVLDLPGGDPGALDGAELVVGVRSSSQRLAPVPLEPGAALACPEGHGLRMWVSTQTPFALRDAVASSLGLEPEVVRVVAPAVGGGFGAKGGAYPEHVVVAAAALRLGHPVRWVEERSENLVAMTHGRAQLQRLELGARRDGTLVGLRASTLNDFGAYPWRGGIAARTSRLMTSGPYRVPRVDVTTKAALTTTTPVGPYRGAGRPEATAVLERAMDRLAGELGVDPAEIRRRNLLTPRELPYETPTGACLDSGDYLACLERALELAGYEGLRAEQRRRRTAGDPVALGVGIACFTEVSGGGAEHGALEVRPDGEVVVTTGSAPHGQGHETTFAQVVAEALGVPMQRVVVVHSDTAVVARGTGTFGSRSGQLGGSALQECAREVAARMRDLAGGLLEAAPEDLVSDGEGRISVAGVPARGIGWDELAGAAGERGVELAAEHDFSQPGGTYPSGTHVAVVEVDTETGAVRLCRLVAVDDCGAPLNPMVVAGQVHGGLAQGVAQALFEEVVYDPDGNPLTTNLVDYLWPSAADLPSFELAEVVTPSPRNPLGAKGIGESGSVGGAAAVHGAVLDALAPFGVEHLDMPLSPEKLWRAIAARGDRRGPEGPGRG